MVCVNGAWTESDSDSRLFAAIGKYVYIIRSVKYVPSSESPHVLHVVVMVLPPQHFLSEMQSSVQSSHPFISIEKTVTGEYYKRCLNMPTSLPVALSPCLTMSLHDCDMIVHSVCA